MIRNVTLILALAAGLSGTLPAADDCEKRAGKKNADWAKSGPHSWLADIEHKQDVELVRTWCRIFETKGFDRVSKGIDFGRVLFTGDGLHPSVGGIVPGSGFAGGLAYNLERATSSPPVRYSGSVEARGSANGFWVAGGKVDIFGAGNNPQDRHIHALFDLEHYHLPQLSYYGLGNSSSVANETLFGLMQTGGRAHLDLPLPGGFSAVGEFGGLTNQPVPVGGASLPSIEKRFTPADTPGISASTAYVVPGAALQWIYPVLPKMNGIATTITAGYRFFHEVSGAPYSFRRLDASWLTRYTPPAGIDLGTVSAAIRFTESYAPAGNAMPFYLQPTLGGTDINNADALRSYRDYRFRAPNLLVFQAEYRRTVWGPLAAFGFYDAGRVALERSDIELAHLRHSFGAGLLIQVGNMPVFKFYYAWGGHEGSHTTYTGNTNNFTFTMPTGVF